MAQRILTDFDMSGNKIKNLPDATEPQQPVTLKQLQGVSYKKYAVDIGDGSATVFSVGHNLGTRDVIVQVRQNISPYQFIEPAATKTATNDSVTIEFNVSPIPAEYRVIILG